MFFEAMHPHWQILLSDQRGYLNRIEALLAEAGESEPYLPAPTLVMRAFQTDPQTVRVLIVGQDPYPTPGHAIGLAFACPSHISPQPRSLQNIRTELASDLGIAAAKAAKIDLANWQPQGVMLLNRTLTVAAHESNSHQKLGWQTFTAAAIAKLYALRAEALVSVLWGAAAQSLSAALGPNIVASAHPSPLSAKRGFFGSKPFSKVNELLLANGQQPIDWMG